MDYRKFKIRTISHLWFEKAYGSERDPSQKRRIEATVDLLRERPDAGDKVPKDRWPPKYRALGLTNLWKIDVGQSARLTYLLSFSEPDVLEVVLIEYLPTHKEYEKRFGY